MSVQDNVTVVEDAYASFKTGNIAHLVNDLLVEDVEWSLPKIEILSHTGLRRGRQSVTRFFTELAENLETLEFEPQEFTAQADKVVVEGAYTWRSKATGKTFESNWVHIFTIKDGKVSKFHEYMDTLALYRAASA